MQTESIKLVFPQLVFPQRVFLSESSKKLLENQLESSLVVSSPKALTGIVRLGLKIPSKKNVVIVESEPTAEKIRSLVRKTSKFTKTVVGIGGGSVLDTAKLLRKTSKTKLILVPTTFGSGSEASQYALLIKDNLKTPLAGDQFLADEVFLFPQLLETLSKSLIFLSFIDAFTHLVEGLVSRKGNYYTSKIAQLGIQELFLGYKYYRAGNPLCWEKFQFAGFLGGIIQSSASVGAVHAFAHVLGPIWKWSHAKAVAYFLPRVIRVNKKNLIYLPKLAKVYNEFHINLLPPKSKLTREALIEKIQSDPCYKTNPRPLTSKEILKIASFKND